MMRIWMLVYGLCSSTNFTKSSINLNKYPIFGGVKEIFHIGIVAADITGD